MMTESFRPSWKDESGVLAVVKCDLPLGMVIEQVENTEGRITNQAIFDIVEVSVGAVIIRVATNFAGIGWTVQPHRVDNVFQCWLHLVYGGHSLSRGVIKKKERNEKEEMQFNSSILKRCFFLAITCHH